MSFITFESFQPENRQSFDDSCFVKESVEKLAVSLREKVLFLFPSPQVTFLHIIFDLHHRHLLDYYAAMFPNVTHLMFMNLAIEADWGEIFAGFENLESIYDQGFHGDRLLGFAQVMSINKNRIKPVNEIEVWINKSGNCFDPNITLPSKLGLNIEIWYGIRLALIPIIETCVQNIRDLEIFGLDCVKSNSQFVEELMKLRDKCERNEMSFLPEVYEDNNYFCEVFETLIKRNVNKSAQLSILSSEQL